MDVTGDRLRDLRKMKRKTLREVNTDTGISYANLSEIENGAHGCTSATLKILADYYNVTTDYLLGNTDNPNAVVIQVNDADGFSATIEHEIIEKMKGFSVTDFQKVSEYIDFLKSKKKMEEKKNNEK